MVYTERAETAAVSRGTSYASAINTPLQWIFKNALYKAVHSCRITCECSESDREQRIALYKQSSIKKTTTHVRFDLCVSFGCIVSTVFFRESYVRRNANSERGFAWDLMIVCFTPDVQRSLGVINIKNQSNLLSLSLSAHTSTQTCTLSLSLSIFD